MANVGTDGSSCLMGHVVSILGRSFFFFFFFFGGSGTGSCCVSQADPLTLHPLASASLEVRMSPCVAIAAHRLNPEALETVSH